MQATGLTERERRRLTPLAAAIRRARQPGPPRVELVAGDLPSAAGHRVGPLAGDLPSAGGVRVGLLAGTFNPLTRAHAALALAGRRAGCERVVLTMAPVSLDKERLERAHALDRLDWVAGWARRRPWAAVAVSSHPLLVDMAEGLAALTGARVALLLGADKAAQLVDPRYYEDLDAALERLAGTAAVLVAPRAGHPAPPRPLAAEPLPTPAWLAERSATEVRAAAAAGADLRGLVPAAVGRAIARTGAYDEDPTRYRARARELEALVRGSAGEASTANRHLGGQHG